MNAVRRANPVEREKTASGGHNWQGDRHGQEKATQRSDFALQKTQSVIKGGWYAVYAMENG